MLISGVGTEHLEAACERPTSPKEMRNRKERESTDADADMAGVTVVLCAGCC